MSVLTISIVANKYVDYYCRDYFAVTVILFVAVLLHQSTVDPAPMLGRNSQQDSLN